MNHIKKNLQNINNELEILAIKNNVDINKNGHWYTRWYDIYFSPLKNDKINILEIGILRGNSHRMWRDYFSNEKYLE